MSTSGDERMNYIDIFHQLSIKIIFCSPCKGQKGGLNLGTCTKSLCFESTFFHLALPAGRSTKDERRKKRRLSESNYIRFLAQVQKMALLDAKPTPTPHSPTEELLLLYIQPLNSKSLRINTSHQNSHMIATLKSARFYDSIHGMV